MDRKLHLSRSNKIIAGVCGGLGEYFDVDPTLVRIIFAILFIVFLAVPTIALYIILWAVIPLEIDN